MAGPHSRSKSPPRSSPKSDGASKDRSRVAPPPTDGEADKVPAKPVPEQQNVGVGAPSRSKSCIGILFVVLGSLVLATSMVASNPNAVQEIQMAVQEIQMRMVKIIAQKELKQAFDRRIDLELALAMSTNEVAMLQNSTAAAQKEAAAAKQEKTEAQKEAAAAKQEKTEAQKEAAAAKQEKTEAQKAAAADKQKADEAQKAAAADKQKAARRPRAAKGSTSEAEDN
jgi:hypothetical protein